MKNGVADAIRELAAEAGRSPIRVGTVSGTSPLEVTLAGQSGLSASHLDAYTPVASDQVLILQSDTDLIILGKIVSGG